MNLNALSAVTLETGRHKLSGFSVSGLATYLQVPDLNVCFDMGECPLSALSLDHVFLTHAHGDHSRCVLRHHSLRDMIGIPKPATYYLPEAIVPAFIAVAEAEARFENAPVFIPPTVVAMKGDRSLVPLRRDLFASAFPVKHRVESLGYTIVERRKKLKPEYEGQDIATLKKQGVEVTAEVDVPLLTFIGDCIGDSLFEQDHIWQSAVVIIETTFITPGEEAMARQKGHTHLGDLVRLLEERGKSIATEHIVLKHFSMKHRKDEIISEVDRAIPAEFRGRVQLLV